MIGNLPFDNLYKFIAIFGLVLMLWSSSGTELTTPSTATELAILTLQHDATNRLQERLAKLATTDVSSKEKSDEKTKQAILAKLEDLDKKETDLLDKLEKVYQRKEWVQGNNTGLGMFVGFCLMVLGFVLWYAQLQRFQDEIIELELKEKKSKVPTV